jgi:glycine dehydrogenase
VSKSSPQWSPFVDRHIGPREHEIQAMLDTLGHSSLDQLIAAVVPASIADSDPLELEPGVSEEAALAELRELARQNVVLKSLIGQGYYGTHTPPVIQRNVLENPSWYTAYTPYQPEISQGRLELLFWFQTMVAELTGLDIANASLLDEGTAAAEAMSLSHRNAKGDANRFLVSDSLHPQTIAVIETRAEPMGIEVVRFGSAADINDWTGVFGAIVQYPGTSGAIDDPRPLAEAAHEHGAMVTVATDLLALMLLKSPGSLGADIAVGSSQRFGVPPGFGGPHAAFLATRNEFRRTMPGRLVGQSIDRHGKPAFRLALQTREQHIRREKATSNICTAQALLAIMSTLYACYHGPEGLQTIARRVHGQTGRLRAALTSAGLNVRNETFFDTLTIETGGRTGSVISAAEKAGFNFRRFSDSAIGISIDETVTEADLAAVAGVFGATLPAAPSEARIPSVLLRDDRVLTQNVFHDYRSETAMMRWLRRLANKDIALDRAMIPLGSCTMKLNAAAELMPVSWPEFSQIHPFAPASQTAGYRKMIAGLEQMLCAATGYDAISLQPNAGSQGEYAGLLAIRRYHQSRGDHARDICLIPQSAHGTNPASASMANMQVVVVQCDENGNIDLADLDAKIAKHRERLAAIMITYPSTHGVFEESVTEVCRKVHDAGGQVYIDGANLNALVGVARPGRFGGDVSHLNLHKTFCIPHGGGGPGVGPVAVRSHLKAFLPADQVNPERQGPQVCSAPFGSAGILPISWMYIRMMGQRGLRRATQVAILNANYIARRLQDKFSVLFAGRNGLIAHECILDTRPFEKEAHVTVDDIAKRLIDYGFHAPTMSFPVGGTLMVEPTESEPFQELERFCQAMERIHAEIQRVQSGEWPADDNPLHNAPHTLESILEDSDRPWSRREAVCPDPDSDYSVKYWPPVGRVDNVYGDRNLVCTCPPVSDYADDDSPATPAEPVGAR